MVEPPAPEVVLDIDEFLGQEVEIPVGARIAVDRQLGRKHRVRRCGRAVERRSQDVPS